MNIKGRLLQAMKEKEIFDLDWIIEEKGHGRVDQVITLNEWLAELVEAGILEHKHGIFRWMKH